MGGLSVGNFSRVWRRRACVDIRRRARPIQGDAAAAVTNRLAVDGRGVTWAAPGGGWLSVQCCVLRKHSTSVSVAREGERNGSCRAAGAAQNVRGWGLLLQALLATTLSVP